MLNETGVPYSGPVRQEPSKLIRAFLGLLVAGLLALAGCGSPFGGDDESDWTDAPVVPELTGDLKEQFLKDVAAADRAGKRPYVFAKVGDSNTELRDNLYGFGCSEVEYGDHTDLKPVVERFRLTQFAPQLALPGCPPANSFSRNSAAARSGTLSGFGSTPGQNLPPIDRLDPACLPQETPIACEIRQIQPRYTIVMTGSNDFGVDRELSGRAGTFTAPRMGLIAAEIRRAGSVPVFSTLPPIYITGTPGVDEWGDVKKANAKIYEASRKLKVPLINLWSALTEPQMIDHGLLPDGIHLSVIGGFDSPEIIGNSVNLSEEALRYGANRRNLIWVQTLAALDEAASSE